MPGREPLDRTKARRYTSRMPQPLTLAAKVKVSRDVLFRELEGETILFNAEKGVYYGLNPVGTRIWHLLKQNKNLTEISRIVAGEYDADAEKIREDLLKLTQDLAKHALLEVNAG